MNFEPRGKMPRRTLGPGHKRATRRPTQKVLMESLDESALYEIVELDDGQVALRRADERGEPLLSVRFSRESLYFLNAAKFEVAKAMIEAGLDAFAEMHEDEFDLHDQSPARVLH